MVVCVAARIDRFEVFCATEQGQRISETTRVELPLMLLCLLSNAGLQDNEVEQARRSILAHGWAKCKYTPRCGTKNVLSVYPHIWNCLC